jgi:N-dimethylarginine dimethylaminohydrolase
MSEITISLEQVEAYIKTLDGSWDEWWAPQYCLFGDGLISFLKSVDKSFGDDADAIFDLHAIEADKLEAERQDERNSTADILKQQTYLLTKFGEAPIKTEGQGYTY